MRGIRGKRARMVKEGTLIATVDIGMTINTAYCSTVDGRDIKPFKFGNSREGFEKLWDMIVATKTRFGCSEVMVGYESTGPYAEPLAQYLMSKPVTMVQVNPLHTKRIKEVNDNFRFHDTRHTFATRLVQNGVDLYAVQKLGRWKSISMVERYAHHCPESLRPGVEALDKIITNLSQSDEKGAGHHSKPF